MLFEGLNELPRRESNAIYSKLVEETNKQVNRDDSPKAGEGEGEGDDILG